MYTLRMMSIPVILPFAELLKTAAALRNSGWLVKLCGCMDQLAAGNGRYQLEVKRPLMSIDQLKDFWNMQVFGFQPDHIGVVFNDIEERDFPLNLMRNEYFSFNADTHTAEFSIRLMTTNGWGDPEEFDTVCDRLENLDRKIRIARKLGQLVGVAMTGNVPACDRLRNEILEQVASL